MKKEKSYLRNILLAYMNKHNLDQKRMAEKLGVTAATLSAWLDIEGHGITLKNAERIKSVCSEVLPEIQNSIDSNFSNDTTAPAGSVVADYRNRLITAFIKSDMEAVPLKQALQIVDSVMK